MVPKSPDLYMSNQSIDSEDFLEGYGGTEIEMPRIGLNRVNHHAIRIWMLLVAMRCSEPRFNSSNPG